MLFSPLADVVAEHPIGILDLTHIVDGLGASAISIAAHRVVVELGMRFPKNCGFYVRIPNLWIPIILLCKLHGINYMTHTSVVGCQVES